MQHICFDGRATVQVFLLGQIIQVLLSLLTIKMNVMVFL